MNEPEKKKLESGQKAEQGQASAPEQKPQVSYSPLGPYKSQWSDQINAAFGKLQNRDPFKFDVNSDALYEQYKNQYIELGNLAMEDTMGQAATLTGGYGNSYAQSVGQQTYQGYLGRLNDVVPQLYQMALDRYTQEGDALMKEYAMLLDRDNQDYGRYKDAAALAQSQVENMLAMGVMPPKDLIEQSGLSPEYIASRLQPAAGGGDGGSSGGGGQGGPGSDSWGPGISEQRNQGGIKGSGWDYTKHNIQQLVNRGDKAGLDKYMNKVAGQMNESQFNQAMSIINKKKR